MKKHRYDAGAYHVTVFDRYGRRRARVWLVDNWQHGVDWAKRWTRRTGGSAMVMRCVFNSLQQGSKFS